MNDAIDHIEITDEDMAGAPDVRPISAASARATRAFAERIGAVAPKPDPTFGEYEPGRIGLAALEIEYAVQEWGRGRFAEGKRAAMDQVLDLIDAQGHFGTSRDYHAALNALRAKIAPEDSDVG